MVGGDAFACRLCFLFQRRKKETCRKIDWGCFPTHFLASMVLLIWITFHSCHLLISLLHVLLFKYHPLLWCKADVGGTTPFVLACFCFMILPFFVIISNVWFHFSHVFVLFRPLSIISGSQFNAYYFRTHITSCIICSYVSLAVALCGILGRI